MLIDCRIFLKKVPLTLGSKEMSIIAEVVIIIMELGLYYYVYFTQIWR